MAIYVSDNVVLKQDEYVDFLMSACHYNYNEAEIRRWEIEYQIYQHCSPVLMKPGSTGVVKFKSVLQRQEIARFVNNREQLSKIIKRRNGSIGNTQWIINYCVSTNGDVFILKMECHNTFTENLSDRVIITESQLRRIIRETLLKALYD